jgi:hypothetical protein
MQNIRPLATTQLVRRCWQADALSRPLRRKKPTQFNQILERNRQMSEQNPNDYPLMPNKDGAPATTVATDDPRAAMRVVPLSGATSSNDNTPVYAPPDNLPTTFEADRNYQGGGNEGSK